MVASIVLFGLAIGALAWWADNHEVRYYKPEPEKTFAHCKHTGGVVTTDDSGTYCVYPITQPNPEQGACIPAWGCTPKK